MSVFVSIYVLCVLRLLFVCVYARLSLCLCVCGCTLVKNQTQNEYRIIFKDDTLKIVAPLFSHVCHRRRYSISTYIWICNFICNDVPGSLDIISPFLSLSLPFYLFRFRYLSLICSCYLSLSTIFHHDRSISLLDDRYTFRESSRLPMKSSIWSFTQSSFHVLISSCKSFWFILFHNFTFKVRL